MKKQQAVSKARQQVTVLVLGVRRCRSGLVGLVDYR